MPPDSIEQVRNLVLVGHRGCGKTSLVEALLFDTGMIKRLGSVDQGTTTSDVDAEETERGISIMTALCYAEHRGHKVNLIDTPGYAEFIAETSYGIWAADIAGICLDGAQGVEIHTRKVWAMARDRGLAVLGIVTKMDKERASVQACVANMKEVLPGCHPVAVQLPIGSEASFSGVIDLLKMKAFTGKGAATDIPADMLEDAQAARAALVEAVVETRDELMEKYLADEAITPDELMSALRAAIAAGAIVPVVVTAGLAEVGTLPILDLVIDLFPNPGQRPAWKGIDPANDNAIERKADPSAPFSAVIFKTITDPYVGRISLLRVTSGMARPDSAVVVGDSGEREKMSGLGLVQGRTTSQTGELWPGDLGCVTRLENAKTGDTLCDPKARIVYPKPHLPTPMHSLALRGETRQDEDKMAPSLERAADEDAGFRYERSTDTGELVVSGMGSLHLETVIARLQRQFGLKVVLSEPKIPYRETVTRKVRVHGRHKKQTGGRGQFGDVWLQLEPWDGGVFEFVDAVVGGSVPNSFIPSVEKGCRSALGKGPLAGFPVVGVRATLDDGQTHPVDSSDLAFQLAGQIAMREALQEANPILLEPIMNVEITSPEDLVGDLVSDLNSRRARILGMEPAGGGMTILRASVPLVEMLRYSADLRSMSQGRANYIMEFDRYDPVPAQQTEQIVTKHKAAMAEEAS